ncbi:hypothetical protein K435DRAFT_874656 [Dendrothele bispora CBS 962.96]|uniref:Uncharacterized protein n=1 Tax=Dendrothele bispora (strain CBS 962.96) TaxID=1314807 RepID=A0A4S8KW26_DENBC|nr:hypothetical protein K435DRAFT_874656 [Dendrothele bispora CBS 962.96]
MAFRCISLDHMRLVVKRLADQWIGSIVFPGEALVYIYRNVDKSYSGAGLTNVPERTPSMWKENEAREGDEVNEGSASRDFEEAQWQGCRVHHVTKFYRRPLAGDFVLDHGPQIVFTLSQLPLTPSFRFARHIKVVPDFYEASSVDCSNSTKEILSLYELAQQVEIQISNTLAQMDQAALKKQDIEKVMKELETAKSNMDSYKAYETQTGVDEDMKKKFMDAQSEKEKQEHLQKTLEGSLDTLTRLIENSIGELATLASRYADLSLSGSFSGQVEKAVKMLEQKNKAMEEKGVDKPTLDRMQKSLDEMKRELDLLRKAQK